MNSDFRGTISAVRVPARSQTDVVVDGVKEMLTSGRLLPGGRLPIEKELAESLGVSRGSLREGVRALVVLGVLETRQGDGTYVTKLSPEQLLAPLAFLADLHSPQSAQELLSVRRVLEAEAVSLAATRITAEQLTAAEKTLDEIEPVIFDEQGDHDLILDADIAFHRIVVAASGNATLTALVESLASRTTRLRLWRGLTLEGAERAAHREHRSILAALRAGDVTAARIWMDAHLLGVEQYLSDQPAPPAIDDAEVAGAEERQ